MPQILNDFPWLQAILFATASLIASGVVASVLSKRQDYKKGSLRWLCYLACAEITCVALMAAWWLVMDGSPRSRYTIDPAVLMSTIVFNGVVALAALWFYNASKEPVDQTEH